MVAVTAEAVDPNPAWLEFVEVRDLWRRLALHHLTACLPVLLSKRGSGLLQGVGLADGSDASRRAERGSLQKPHPLLPDWDVVLVDAPHDLGVVEHSIVVDIRIPGLAAFGDVLGALVAKEEAQVCASHT
jgi:hypothetical protein